MHWRTCVVVKQILTQKTPSKVSLFPDTTTKFHLLAYNFEEKYAFYLADSFFLQTTFTTMENV